MSRAVVAVVALAVLIASPGVATAVVGVLDGGQGTSELSTGAPGVAGGTGSPGVDTGSPAVGTGSPVTDDDGTGTQASAGPASAQDGGDGSVDVTTGSQLSTVLSTTEDEVGTEVSQSAFDSRFAMGNESQQAALVASRADALASAAAAVSDNYTVATNAYENGTIDRSTYAQRLATLDARAASLRASIGHLRDRAATVSDLELASAGYDASTLDDAVDDLDTVTSVGSSAVHRRFTGQSNGSVAVEASESGVTVEVETEGGERSREVRQSGDDDRNLTVSVSEALSTARGALSDRHWTLRGTSVEGDDGSYEFEFGLAGANETGSAEVRVDGSSGTVVRLEEEIEPRERDSDDGDDPALSLVLVDGDPGPGATVTLEARQGGSPVADVPVFVDDGRVGTTDADGRIDVTLGSEETEITAERGDGEAELEFEFEREDDRGDGSERPVDGLDVSADLDGDTVTVTVTYRDEGVPGAQVSADGDRVGPTGPDGTVSFDHVAGESLELEITRGQLEVERTYRVENGTLVRGESDVDDGGDDVDDDERSGELNLSVVDGDPAPNATVTLEATVGDDPAPGVQVFVDDRRVGSTGSDGRIDVTLGDDDTEVTAERGDSEAELEFEFEGTESDTGDETNETERGNGNAGELGLSVVDGDPAPNATVTLEATVGGDAAAGVQVFVDGDRVGSTGSDGRIDVTLGADDAEVTAERGDREAELEFEFDDEDASGDVGTGTGDDGPNSSGNGTDDSGDDDGDDNGDDDGDDDGD